MRIELKTYRNARNLPDGKYQNHDVTHNKFFVKIDGDDLQLVLDFKDMKNEPISRDIYFSPSLFPRAGRYIAGASCFADWIIPAAPFIFEVRGDQITVTMEEKNLSLREYQSIIHEYIKRDILKFYEQHSTMTLMFSGGIDSMVILSYIMHLGLLPRTRLLFYRNLTQSKATFRDEAKMIAINGVLDMVKGTALGIIDTEEVDERDVAYLANNFSYDKFTPYVTSTMIKRFPDMKFIAGRCGNEALLHYTCYVNQKLIETKDFEALAIAQSRPNLYCCDLKDYKPDLDNLFGTDWYILQGRSLLPLHESLFIPFGSHDVLSTTRKLNFNDVTFDTILNAELAKEILRETTGNTLLNFLTTETPNDNDTLNEIKIPFDMLDQSVFNIPTCLHHNEDGLNFLKHEYELSRERGYVPINTMVAYKAIQRIGELVLSAYNYHDVDLRPLV